MIAIEVQNNGIVTPPPTAEYHCHRFSTFPPHLAKGWGTERERESENMIIFVALSVSLTAKRDNVQSVAYAEHYKTNTRRWTI